MTDNINSKSDKKSSDELRIHTFMIASEKDDYKPVKCIAITNSKHIKQT
jgi:hypothetical protein